MANEETAPESARPWRWPLAAVLLAAGIGLIVFPGPVAQYTGYHWLNDHAQNLIDETLQRDQGTFLVITAIKTSLAVIEGSSVGVGFELEIGDIAQPAYDYVDFFWEMFLYAFLVMGFYKLLLETGLLELGFAFAGIGLGVLAIPIALPMRRLAMSRWGRRCLLGGLLFTYAVPVALIATNALSERYMSAIRTQHLEKIESLQTDLEALSSRFTALRAQIDVFQPSKSYEDLKTGMLDIVRQAGNTLQSGMTAFLYYVLVIAFEIVFFPFVSAYLLYKFGQLALGRFIPAPATEAVPAEGTRPAAA